MKFELSELEVVMLDQALGNAIQSCNRSSAKSSLTAVKSAYAKMAMELTDMRMKLQRREGVK